MPAAVPKRATPSRILGRENGATYWTRKPCWCSAPPERILGAGVGPPLRMEAKGRPGGVARGVRRLDTALDSTRDPMWCRASALQNLALSFDSSHPGRSSRRRSERDNAQCTHLFSPRKVRNQPTLVLRQSGALSQTAEEKLPRIGLGTPSFDAEFTCQTVPCAGMLGRVAHTVQLAHDWRAHKWPQVGIPAPRSRPTSTTVTRQR